MKNEYKIKWCRVNNQNKIIMKTFESFRKNIVEFSKENKNICFYVRCTNYSDNNTYYLKSGILAIAKTFNTQYDFQYNKVSMTKLDKDGIYLASEIEATEKNIKSYNL